MAIYMCSIKIITRGEGRSAVAAAAYRSGERIENQWDGVTHDYSKKEGIVYTDVMLPKQAPKEYADRSVLWNAVEQAEKSSRSRLARECLLALPKELSREEQIELVTEYVQDNFVSQGMCADIAIHDPVLTDDLHRPIDEDGNLLTDPSEYRHNNPHAHILLTVRPIDEDGKWESKSQKEYVCRRGNEEYLFTSVKFREAQKDGWEKIYHYRTEDGEAWLTPSEAEEQGLVTKDRVTRDPKSHVVSNPTTAKWNDQARIDEWRQSWADCVNRYLANAGSEERVDARSYEEQGIDRIPTEHKGTYINTAEKRQRRLAKEGRAEADSEITKTNKALKAYNDTADQYHRIEKTAQTKVHSVAKRMETLRSKSIRSTYTGSLLRQGLTTAIRLSAQQENDIQACEDMMQMMAALNEKSAALIDELTRELAGLGRFRRTQKKELEERIAAENQNIRDRTDYVRTEMQRRGFGGENALREAAGRQAQERKNLDHRAEQASESESQASESEREYRVLDQSVPGIYRDQLWEKQAEMRTQAERELQEQLRKEMRENFSLSAYTQAEKDVKKQLEGKESDPERESPVKATAHHRTR